MTPELHRPWFSHYEPSVPRTVTVFDQPLYSLLDEAAARYPKRPALIFQNTRLSESIAKRMIKYLLFARSHEIWQREIL